MEEGFTSFVFPTKPYPYSLMPLRNEQIRSCGCGERAPFKPADLARWEASSKVIEVRQLEGYSPVLGKLDTLILPPHSPMVFYGRKLDWSERQIRNLVPLGHLEEASHISGEILQSAMEALRSVTQIRLGGLAAKEPNHLVSDPAKRLEAAEDLARYWLFILVVRYDPEMYAKLLP